MHPETQPPDKNSEMAWRPRVSRFLLQQELTASPFCASPERFLSQYTIYSATRSIKPSLRRGGLRALRSEDIVNLLFSQKDREDSRCSTRAGLPLRPPALSSLNRRAPPDFPEMYATFDYTPHAFYGILWLAHARAEVSSSRLLKVIRPGSDRK